MSTSFLKKSKPEVLNKVQMNLFLRRYESLVYALIKHKITISWGLKQRIKYKFLKKALIHFFESGLRAQKDPYIDYFKRESSLKNFEKPNKGGQKNVRIRVGR